jgi:hypothetical protein
MLVESNFPLVAKINQKTVVKAPGWLYVPRVIPVGKGVTHHQFFKSVALMLQVYHLAVQALVNLVHFNELKLLAYGF